ncbi:leucine rich adaptor protein 1-like [Xenentodon cancila]
MAEEILSDPFPDLNELEMKIGRKTPESLLVWMRDAAACGDGWRSDVLDRDDSNSAFCDNLCDKINSLKQEMKQLRLADVRILQQLVAIHEGIEAMRWLMEEKGTSTSHGSSLTGSLSSLVIVEEHGSSMSPCRKSPSPAFPLDVTEMTREKAADQKPSQTQCVDPGAIELNSGEVRPPSPPSSKITLRHSAHGAYGPASVTSDTSAVTVFELQKHDSVAAQMQNIRRALLRSNRGKGHLKVDSDGSSLDQQSEKNSVHPAPEIFTPSQDSSTEESRRSPTPETALLGYDAQWCWVESQDDVTFL